MKVLLSWSGPVSHEIAKFMRDDWLKNVLPGCEPWVSSEDIQKGKPWWDELHSLLGQVKAVVIIVTQENIRSPWLYYEAGAVAAKLEGIVVCPYLVEVAMKHLYGTPFSNFQCTEADKSDTLKLIRSLHTELGSPHDPALLEGNFKAQWPRLKGKIEREVENLPEVEDEVKQTEPPLIQQLSSEAVALLRAAGEASENRRGYIIGSRTNQGLSIQAGDQSFCRGGDPRAEATWEQAVEELESHSLLAAAGHQREVFRLTGTGWKVFDTIPPAPAPSA